MTKQWKITINGSACIGAGVCTGIAPKHFRLGGDGKSHPVYSLIDADPRVLDAAWTCPSEAITIMDSDPEQILSPGCASSTPPAKP